MSTKRLQIRDALAALIATATGLTVHKNLDFAIEDQSLPVAAITSEHDAVDVDGGSQFSGVPEMVHADFSVRLMVSRSADPESDADGHEQLLRAAVVSNASLGGLAVTTRYLGGDWDFDLGDSAVRRLVFKATFIS